MKTYSIFAIVVLCVSLTAVAAEPESPFKVGEKWVYKHEGPRIQRWELLWEDQLADEHIKEVISVEEKNGEKIWVIKEHYGPTDIVQTHYYVDEDNLVGKFVTMSPQTGAVITINKPAYPLYCTNLKIGEEKEFKSQRTTNPFYSTYPFSIKFKRLEDQTIEVPAGKFENCQHYKANLSYTVAMEFLDYTQTSITQEIDMWYHSKANGIVKQIIQSEEYEYIGEMKPGYTVINLLKSHSKGQ